MDSQEIVTIVAAVAVPVVTFVLGVVGVVVQDWRARRSHVSRRKLAIDDARAQVAFVTDWWTATKAVHQSAGPLDDAQPLQEAAARASAFLARASALVSATELPTTATQPPLSLRRLALLYPFQTVTGKVVRAAFFVCGGVTFTTLASSVSHRLSDDPADQALVLDLLIAGAVLSALSLTLRFLAVGVEATTVAAISRGEPDRGFLRRALLLYRLRRPAAAWVRVLFYLALLGVARYVWYATANTLDWGTLAWLPLYVAATVVFLTWAVGLRQWAVSLQRSAAADPEAAGSQTHRHEGPDDRLDDGLVDRREVTTSSALS